MATLFERIAAGELPADIVYKDAEITAFRDIHPRAPVHILIVPNKPIPTANDITDADAPLVGGCSWSPETSPGSWALPTMGIG